MISHTQKINRNFKYTAGCILALALLLDVCSLHARPSRQRRRAVKRSIVLPRPLYHTSRPGGLHRLLNRSRRLIDRACRLEKDLKEASPGLVMAVAHQKRARRLLSVHRHRDALRHTIRARQLARAVIVQHRQKLEQADHDNDNDRAALEGTDLAELDRQAEPDRPATSDPGRELKPLEELPGPDRAGGPAAGQPTAEQSTIRE